MVSQASLKPSAENLEDGSSGSIISQYIRSPSIKGLSVDINPHEDISESIMMISEYMDSALIIAETISAAL